MRQRSRLPPNRRADDSDKINRPGIRRNAELRGDVLAEKQELPQLGDGPEESNAFRAVLVEHERVKPEGPCSPISTRTHRPLIRTRSTRRGPSRTPSVSVTDRTRSSTVSFTRPYWKRSAK